MTFDSAHIWLVVDISTNSLRIMKVKITKHLEKKNKQRTTFISVFIELAKKTKKMKNGFISKRFFRFAFSLKILIERWSSFDSE